MSDKDRDQHKEPGQPRGVKVLSAHSEGTGVETLSTREPGDLETTVETANGDVSGLGPDGKRIWK